jgi:hypothetical protein
MMNDDQRERRLIEFLALEWRGLVVRRELPDGSAELYFPQPDHPRWATASATFSVRHAWAQAVIRFGAGVRLRPAR